MRARDIKARKHPPSLSRHDCPLTNVAIVQASDKPWSLHRRRRDTRYVTPTGHRIIETDGLSYSAVDQSSERGMGLEEEAWLQVLLLGAIRWSVPVIRTCHSSTECMESCHFHFLRL